MSQEMMAFKYRIYPLKYQKRIIDQWIHNCWVFYRYVLHHYQDDYTFARQNFHDKIFSYYCKNVAYHPNWYIVTEKPKIPKEYFIHGAPLNNRGKSKYASYQLVQKIQAQRSNFKLMPVCILQEVLDRVDFAFKKFWKEGKRYPRYPKEKEYNSITWQGKGSIRLNESECKLWLVKFPGLLKVKYHRPIKGKIKRANISRDILGQYFVSFMCEIEEGSKKITTQKILGIDMNIKQLDDLTRSFITLSSGNHIDIPRWFNIYERKLGKAQKKRSKCKIGSTDWQKYSRHIKHLYDDIQNKRNDWLHNLTYWIASEYDYVAIEDLVLTDFHKKQENWREMPSYQLNINRGLRKAWRETPFGEFKRQLLYKMKDRVIIVDPKNTSKQCNKCHYINESLALSDRKWICPQCGIFHDRDTNAALNIKERALQQINSIREMSTLKKEVV